MVKAAPPHGAKRRQTNSILIAHSVLPQMPIVTQSNVCKISRYPLLEDNLLQTCYEKSQPPNSSSSDRYFQNHDNSGHFGFFNSCACLLGCETLPQHSNNMWMIFSEDSTLCLLPWMTSALLAWAKMNTYPTWTSYVNGQSNSVQFSTQNSVSRASQVEFLGYMVNALGTFSVSEKATLIVTYPAPTSR